MFVVIDTNIWVDELGLRSGLGTAARYHLKRAGFKLALPEVIELEVLRHLRRNALEQKQALVRAHGRLTTLISPIKDLVLPPDEEILDRIQNFFSSVGMDIHRIPFSIESAHQSFIKTIDKLPPSGRNAQFKDGVIWADCLALLDISDVTLITNDAAFYEDLKYEQGLAKNLRAEAATKPHNITIYNDLSAVATQYSSPLKINKRQFAELYVEGASESVDSILSKYSISLGEVISVNIEFYLTEDIAVLHSIFDICCSIVDRESGVDRKGKFIFYGEGTYNPIENEFYSTQAKREHLELVTENGEIRRINRQYAALNDVIGHQDVFHKVRQPIKIDGLIE